MCDSVLTFGQRGSHFFQCPSRREYTRLPRKLQTLLTSSQLKQVYHVCLGFEDSFLLTWRDANEQDRIDTSGLPADLVAFLYKKDSDQRLVREISSIRCVLGPYNSSYLAHDGSAYVWMNLPEKLLEALQSRIVSGRWIDRPRLVALGSDANFALLTEKNAAVWQLNQYHSVSKRLATIRTQRFEISKIHQVALHPYRFQGSIVHLSSGKLIADNLPAPAWSSFQVMHDTMLQDTTSMRSKPLFRSTSELKPTTERKPSVLQQRAQLRREWSEHSQEFTAQARGLKVSLSLNISLGGLSKMLG